jgi:transcriptional regulator with XRE-family HTH domain
VQSFPKERTPLLVQLIERQLSQGWNQTQLAKAVGVSPPTIGRWLKGENLPDANVKFCKIYRFKKLTS